MTPDSIYFRMLSSKLRVPNQQKNKGICHRYATSTSKSVKHVSLVCAKNLRQYSTSLGRKFPWCLDHVLIKTPYLQWIFYHDVPVRSPFVKFRSGIPNGQLMMAYALHKDIKIPNSMSMSIMVLDIPSGNLLHNYGKIHHF